MMRGLNVGNVLFGLPMTKCKLKLGVFNKIVKIET